jgi:hypothetical protein
MGGLALPWRLRSLLSLPVHARLRLCCGPAGVGITTTAAPNGDVHVQMLEGGHVAVESTGGKNASPDRVVRLPYSVVFPLVFLGRSDGAVARQCAPHGREASLAARHHPIWQLGRQKPAGKEKAGGRGGGCSSCALQPDPLPAAGVQGDVEFSSLSGSFRVGRLQALQASFPPPRPRPAWPVFAAWC